MRNKASS